jgi:YesN/AraC family two-component response regulator
MDGKKEWAVDFDRKIAYDDLDLKIQIGNLLISVLYIRYVPTKPNLYIKYHCHSSYELHFIKYGKGNLIADGKSYEIGPGTFYLTGPQVYHEQRTYDRDPMAEFCINFELTVLKRNTAKSDYFFQIEAQEIAKVLRDTHFWFGQDECNNVALFETIMEELEHKITGYHHSVRNCVSQIIINAVRCYTNHKMADYKLPQRTLNEKREQLLSSLFNQNVSDLSLAHLADQLGVSKRQASRIIQKYYQLNFKEKHTGDRLELAKNLLLTTDLPIELVAEKAGFTSTSYFCKKFKESWGATPSQFRKQGP